MSETAQQGIRVQDPYTGETLLFPSTSTPEQINSAIEKKNMLNVRAPDGSIRQFSPRSTPDEINQELGTRSWGNMLSGAGKALGVGLAKVPIAIAGLPGDIQTLGTKAGYGINKLIGGEDYAQQNWDRMQPQMDATHVPGSQDIQRFIEDNVTGKFREPVGPVESLIDKAAPFAVGAIGAPSVASAVMRTAIPFAASEGAGQVADRVAPDLAPYARFGGALLGGAGAYGLENTAFGSAKLSLPTGENMTRTASNMLTNAARGNEQKMTGLTDAMGGDTMLLNGPKGYQAIAHALLNKQGPAADAIEAALIAQREQFPVRAENMLTQNAGPYRDHRMALQDMAEARKAEVGPMYQDAINNAPEFRTPELLSEISQRTSTPFTSMSAEDAANASNNLNRIDYALQRETPSQAVAALHGTRQNLDRTANSVMGDPNQAFVAGNFRGAIDSVLKDKVPGFAEADARFAHLKGLEDNVQAGFDAVKGNQVMSPEARQRFFADMQKPSAGAKPTDPSPMDSFRLGDRSNLGEVFGTRNNELQALKNRIGADAMDWQRQHTADLYGQDAAANMGKFLNAEQTKRQQFQELLGNSKTAKATEAINQFNDKTVSIPKNATGTGIIGALGEKALRGIFGAIVKSGGKATEADLAKALTLSGKQREEFVTQLLKSAQNRGSIGTAIAKSGTPAMIENSNPRRKRRGKQVR